MYYLSTLIYILLGIGVSIGLSDKEPVHFIGSIVSTLLWPMIVISRVVEKYL